MPGQRVLLYDLSSNDADGNKPWSPSTWKIHILLRHLNIPYTTMYLDFPDLEPKFKALNIPPTTNPDAHAAYTVPMLHFIPNDTTPASADDYIMDSDAIIHALHSRGYLTLTRTLTSLPLPPSPTPSPILLQLPSLATLVETHTTTLTTALTPFILPGITALLPPSSAAYYRAKHSPSLPPSIPSFEALRASTSLETCFRNAKPGIVGLEMVARQAAQLRSTPTAGGGQEGGKLLTWEEMTILALLAFLGRIESRLWEGVMGVAGEEADRIGGEWALGELWCRGQAGGLAGEVFGSH